jgi:sarcosine oxidase
MTEQRDIAVVGAGLLGLATARALAALGRDVVVLEQAVVGHDGAGSKGSCRIFRLGYPEPDYVAAARLAGQKWRELEAESGRQVLLPTAHLTFGTQLNAVHDAMRQAGAPCELLSAAEAATAFPAIAVGGPALLEPDSAVIAAAEALAALAAAAPELRTGVRVTGLTDDGSRVTLRTSADPVTARVAVVTAGPWTAGLLAGLGVSLPTRPTLEQVGYLQPTGGSLGALPAPIFICHEGPSPYGLPVPGSSLYKIGIHQSGPVTDPEAQSQRPDPGLAELVTQAAARYLPGYDPRPVMTERCVYDNTPDEDFVLDRVGNVVIGCGTSGHAFKFGPLLGDWLAGLATGQPAPAARFAIGRFGRSIGSPR